MGEAERYGASWADYRRRVRWFLGSAGGFVGAGVVGIALLLASAPTPVVVPVAVVGVVTWVAIMVGAYRLQDWRCPRCGHLFALRNTPLARRCMSCGLPKWSTDGRS